MASPYALDFSPLTQAFQNNAQLGLQKNRLAMEEQRLGHEAERLGFERDLQPLKVQAQKQAVASGGMQLNKEKANSAIGFVQAHVMADGITPEERAVRWERLRSSPLFKDDPHFNDPVYGQLWKDPITGPQMLVGLARGYQDPLAKQKIEADIAKDNAQAGLYKAQTNQVGAKTPIIKDGDKPLVALEPDANGRLQARTIYEGTQGNVQRGIEGGFRELHAIPDRYGGDNGTFSNAVGAFQGNPDSWVGTVARPIGSFMSNFATGPGNSAPPSEVRRAIEGATNTLAASLKPLIRKPGEGSWSDRDQAVLDSIVGNLSRANDVAQYDRELNNVRLRIKSNFGLDLPELVRKPNTGRLPDAEPNPAQARPQTPQSSEGKTATNPRTGQRIIFRNGQWQPL